MTAPRAWGEIEAAAAARKGADGVAAAIAGPMARSATPAELAAIPDHRWLSQFSKRVFQAGFNWSVIDGKWGGFEEAFDGFDPARWAMASDDDLDALMKDVRIVRHAKKIESVRGNAIMLTELATDRGAAANAFAEWPDTDFVGLLAFLKQRGARLGGSTAQYALRAMGKPSLIFSPSVVAALIRAGVVDKAPTSKSAMAKVQAAASRWMAESGRSLTEISRVLAISVDD